MLFKNFFPENIVVFKQKNFENQIFYVFNGFQLK